MCTEEFIRMMFTVNLYMYGNRGLDSRNLHVTKHVPYVSDMVKAKQVKAPKFVSRTGARLGS